MRLQHLLGSLVGFVAIVVVAGACGGSDQADQVSLDYTESPITELLGIDIALRGGDLVELERRAEAGVVECMLGSGFEAKMIRVGMVASVLVLLATIAPAGLVSQADAHDDAFRRATPSNDCAYGESFHCGAWTTNGCTVVPDRVWGVFNFNHACDHHDGCYGGQWASRYGCDATMWYDMNSTCSEMWSWWHPSRGACRVVRDTYYAGVRALGWHAYNQSSINAALG